MLCSSPDLAYCDLTHLAMLVDRDKTETDRLIMTWNPLGKKVFLTSKPTLTNGLVSHVEERELEIAFVQLQEMEDHIKKLYKEVRKYEDCIENMHKLEQKMSSELSNSAVCQENDQLHSMASNYQSVVYQMGHNTADLVQLSQKTVVDPMKKLGAEFATISAALKKRDLALSECLKAQAKYEKQNKLEKTGTNVVKTEQMKKAFFNAKVEFESQNRLLLVELPQFYEKRIDYFQPCLQALIRAQLDYFGETTRLFTHLVSANPDSTNLVSDHEHKEQLNSMMEQLKALSIVGKN